MAARLTLVVLYSLVLTVTCSGLTDKHSYRQTIMTDSNRKIRGDNGNQTNKKLHHSRSLNYHLLSTLLRDNDNDVSRQFSKLGSTRLSTSANSPNTNTEVAQSFFPGLKTSDSSSESVMKCVKMLFDTRRSSVLKSNVYCAKLLQEVTVSNGSTPQPAQKTAEHSAIIPSATEPHNTNSIISDLKTIRINLTEPHGSSATPHPFSHWLNGTVKYPNSVSHKIMPTRIAMTEGRTGTGIAKGSSNALNQSETSMTDDMITEKRGQGLCLTGFPFIFSENDPLPWTCGQRRRWRSLPDNFFPNRLYETVCESQSCMNGHYNCTPIFYTTHLLQLCTTANCHDDRAPMELRRMWRFVDIRVTVGCTCSR